MILSIFFFNSSYVKWLLHLTFPLIRISYIWHLLSTLLQDHLSQLYEQLETVDSTEHLAYNTQV